MPIKLNINESKEISFDMRIEGVQYKDISGTVRLTIEGIEYGFPANVNNDTISVEIPALENITKAVLSEGQEIDVRLDIIAGDTTIIPWKDVILIERPIRVEASVSGITDIVEKKKPKIEVKTKVSKVLHEKKKNEKKKPIIKSRLREKMNK